MRCKWEGGATFIDGDGDGSRHNHLSPPPLLSLAAKVVLKKSPASGGACARVTAPEDHLSPLISPSLCCSSDLYLLFQYARDSAVGFLPERSHARGLSSPVTSLLLVALQRG
ncbi:hypothetical protein Bca4012_038190 [Brassica carinata]